jgi:cation diffusion facilitator family transporter
VREAGPLQRAHAHERGRGEPPRGHRHRGTHAHGLPDRGVVRSRAGLRAVATSLGVLAAAAAAQLTVFALSGSMALLADLIHNFGDALTALPLGVAFLLRSPRAEKAAGRVVVVAILVSAGVALYESIARIVHPQALSHLGIVAAAGLIGFAGNEIAARVRLRAGRRLGSPALVADGNHARIDGIVSLAVVASAAAVFAGARLADPVIGLLITLAILKIAWDSWHVVSGAQPEALAEPNEG